MEEAAAACPHTRGPEHAGPVRAQSYSPGFEPLRVRTASRSAARASSAACALSSAFSCRVWNPTCCDDEKSAALRWLQNSRGVSALALTTS